MQLAEGMVVAGRFRLGHMLGRGGMGSVWRAQHLGLEVPCAIKFIEGELAALPEAQARFQREAKAAAQLRSPHVVQILDHGVWDGVPYIAMELLEGEELGKRLQRVGRLTPQETCSIVGQVCRALSKAHSMGIVHRDLKPENIFLVRDDDREIAKVLDFGIAKSRSQDLGGSSNTKTGAMLGTPYYMSPEQAQGTKQVDLRTDLWALAVICFQALTGRLPFDSEALGDLLVKIIVHPLPIASQYGQVPIGFDAWWAKAAARDPAERFQNAKDFSDSLALVCGVSQVSGIVNLPALARAPAATPRSVGTASPLSRSVLPGVPTARSRALVAGGIAIAGVLTLGVGGFAVWRFAAPGASSAGASSAGAPKAASAPGDLVVPADPRKQVEPAASPAVTREAPSPAAATPPGATASAPVASSSASAGGDRAAPGSSPSATTAAQVPSQGQPQPLTRRSVGAAPAPVAHTSTPQSPPPPSHTSKPSFNAGF